MMLMPQPRRRAIWCFSFLAIGLLVTTAASQQETPAGSPASVGLAILEQYLGAWTLTEHHYDATGKIVASIDGSEQIGWVLDEQAIQRTYISKSESRTFRAIGLLSWNEFEESYHGTWLDNLSRGGPTVVRGEWDPKRQSMVFKYTVLSAKDSTRAFQVIERFVDHSTRIATTFETTGGTVQKRFEVEYKRAVPCPGKIRVISGIGE